MKFILKNVLHAQNIHTPPYNADMKFDTPHSSFKSCIGTPTPNIIPTANIQKFVDYNLV